MLSVNFKIWIANSVDISASLFSATLSPHLLQLYHTFANFSMKSRKRDEIRATLGLNPPTRKGVSFLKGLHKFEPFWIFNLCVRTPTDFIIRAVGTPNYILPSIIVCKIVAIIINFFIIETICNKKHWYSECTSWISWNRILQKLHTLWWAGTCRFRYWKSSSRWCQIQRSSLFRHS